MGSRSAREFSEDWKDEVCQMVADGESIRAIDKKKDPRIPSARTIYKALDEDPVFAQQYARARDEQADNIFHETRTIADGVKETHEAIAKAKLRVDQRKWAAGKLSPRKYGTHNVALQADVNIENATPEDEREAVKANLPLVIGVLNDLGYDVIEREA